MGLCPTPRKGFHPLTHVRGNIYSRVGVNNKRNLWLQTKPELSSALWIMQELPSSRKGLSLLRGVGQSPAYPINQNKPSEGLDNLSG